jgi:hypothetical protein
MLSRNLSTASLHFMPRVNTGVSCVREPLQARDESVQCDRIRIRREERLH